MAHPQKLQQGRKNILKAGIAMVAGLGLWKWFSPATKAEPAKTIRMLSEDGELVEIDASLISSNGNPSSAGGHNSSHHGKISNEALKHFVKRK